MPLTDWPQHHADAFADARVLVTGGAGFIGSHLVEALLALGAQVTVLDDLTGGDPRNFDTFADDAGGRLRFVEGTILDAALLGDLAAGCGYVFHLAALGSVPDSVQRPGAYHEVNTTGTLRVLEAAREAGVRRVVFSASSAIYGDDPALPKAEAMPPAPKSPYAATKAAGEALLAAYAGSYDAPDTAALRYFNVFGPRQNANSAYAAVIAAFAHALQHGQRPTIFGDGLQTRDFVYVDNVVHANLLAARCPQPLGGGAFNIATGTSITVNDLAQRMAAAWGTPGVTPDHQPERAGDVKHSAADITRARDTLGYDTVVDFDAGLNETINWFRAQI